MPNSYGKQTLEEHIEEENKKTLRQRIREQVRRDIEYSGGSNLTPLQIEEMIDRVVIQEQEKQQISNDQLTREEWKKQLAEKVDEKLKPILEKNLKKDDDE